MQESLFPRLEVYQERSQPAVDLKDIIGTIPPSKVRPIERLPGECRWSELPVSPFLKRVPLLLPLGLFQNFTTASWPIWIRTWPKGGKAKKQTSWSLPLPSQDRDIGPVSTLAYLETSNLLAACHYAILAQSSLRSPNILIGPKRFSHRLGADIHDFIRSLQGQFNTAACS